MVTVKKKLLSVNDLVHAAAGTLKGSIRPEDAVSSVCIDSRTCGEDALFVPLKGERTDGHHYIIEAADKGARCTYTSVEYWKENRDALQQIAARQQFGYICVADPLTAMQQAATLYLDRLTSVRRVGITGSSGKTTTKELIGAVVREGRSAAVSRGNYNSDIGVCLAAFEVDEENEVGVFELGMNRIGEMAAITRIVKPDVAVITNIGTAHIGLLGSREAIAREKKEIFSLFTEASTGFIFEDEPYFSFLQSGVKGTIHPYGPKTLDGYEYGRDLGLDGIELGWRGHAVRIALPGRVYINNACAAIAVALHFGIGETEIVEGLEKIEPLFGRGEIRRGSVDIICDYYNANPESMDEALHFLMSLHTEGRKVAVLGDMAELGSYSAEAHRQLGEQLTAASPDLVFLAGEQMREAYRVLSPNLQDRAFWSEDPREVSEKLKAALRKGDIVLIKGSRAAALEEVERLL